MQPNNKPKQTAERSSMKSKEVTVKSLRSMRHTRFPIAAFGAILLSIGAAQASNILFNGYLDTTAVIDIQPDGNLGQVNPCPVGWNVEATKTISGVYYDGGDSEPWCNVTPPSAADGFGFFFKPFTGSTNENPALNDLATVKLFQDNATTPGTKFTLSAYVASEANCSLNQPGPAKALLVVEFLDNTGTVLASNAYDLVANGMPSGGTSTMTQMTTPEYTAPSGTATVRAGVYMIDTWSTTGAQSFFADNIDLEATPPPGSPDITSQPVPATVAPGDTAQFTVVATGATGYAWQFNGNAVTNGGAYSGADTATLTITGTTVTNLGHYRVLVSNSSGSVFSSDAALAFQALAINPVITINGKVGDTYRTDYTTSLDSGTWTPLATNTLKSTTLTIIDPVSATTGMRYYRSVFLY